MILPDIYRTIVSLLAESKSGAQALREVWSFFRFFGWLLTMRQFGAMAFGVLCMFFVA